MRGGWTWLPVAAAVGLVAWLALVPLGFMLWQSVLTPQTAATAARFTLDNYRTAYASADTARLLTNSLQFALGSAALAFALGTFLAWINERTDTPFKPLFFALTLVPLIIPGILFTVSWIFLGSPKIGLVNLALQRAFATDAVFINIYSIPGMIWVDGLHYSPMAFLLMTAAFRAMDPALEESAMMSGATLPRILWRVTIRLASPATAAALLILFVRALESFEVPALLGLPVGIEVYTSAIYDAIHAYPSEIGLASAYGVALLAKMGWESGIRGFVCSPQEAAALRALTGPEGILVTPGIRPSGSDIGDQQRIATPTLALQQGASYLVVGRPITQAPDPALAAEAVLLEIAEALAIAPTE